MVPLRPDFELPIRSSDNEGSITKNQFLNSTVG
jgi:hypothetical protein